MNVTIYHNPRCSKSRQTLELIRDRGIEPEVVEYLKNPPTVEELSAILDKLQMDPRELMRQKETEFKLAGLDDETLDRATMVKKMVEFPKVIERPLVVSGDRAAVGRPPENVLKIL